MVACDEVRLANLVHSKGYAFRGQTQRTGEQISIWSDKAPEYPLGSSRVSE